MPDGKMSWRVNKNYKLPGFEDESEGMIAFNYTFPSGKQEKDGSVLSYMGTQRQAFLPLNPEGISVFNMLITAFEQRVTFIIGTSLTTG